MIVNIPIGPGELIDKITILEIKADRLSPREKQANVRTELAALVAARNAAIRPSPQLDRLTEALRVVNQTLWWVEDELRHCERKKDFGPCFIALARSVYRINDQRAALKREINGLLEAIIVEEKFYAAY